MDLRKWSQLSRDQDLRRDRGQSSQPLRDQDVGNRGHSFRPTGNDPDVEHRRPARNQDVEEVEEESFNILPLHDMLADHDALRFPEVRAARAALQVVGELARPEGWRQSMDMLDWLALLFGFQAGNVKNQREHIVMLLANKQMQLQPPPDPIDCMDAKIVHKLRKKVLKNYSSWCSYLGKANNLWLGRNNEMQEQQRELLYTSLYLLIWGEAANLRFMPESLCFIFHNMAGEMNKVLEHGSNDVAQQSRSVYSGENAFLLRVITPLYKIVKAEAEASHEGKAPHSSWRNYDDMNEFFWSKRCLTQLSWPLNLSCSFMAEPSTQQRKVGKTGFVEQRSFWNIFRSFDHLWTGYILLLQAMIIMAFHSGKPPWTQLVERDVQARILSIFITWAGLRILQCLLDVLMQFRLISVDTMLIGLRMLLKIAAASVWTLVFVLLYTNMWKERHTVGGWSAGANTAFILFLEVALVFILPEILALTLFILPWIRNFVEKSDLRIFHVLTWWFQSRWFVGRGLREGIWDNIKYTLFWLIVFLVKFSFSYFLQIRPLVEPTKQLLALNNINYSWHEFWGKGSNRIAVSVLWAPVLLIYFMDMQIWYTVFSSFAGALVGLFGHLGEIRNMEQMKLRFPFFASAVAFNLMPGESLLETKAWGSWLATVSNAWHRLKLRYGLGAHYKRHATDSLEAGRFAFMWNSIISILREEDLLSDRELQLLEIPAPAWNISVIQWPSLLLSNELRLALGQVKQWNGTDDKWLWRKICKIEHRRCAVIECYDSIRHVLRRIIREGSEEHGRVERLLLGIQYSLESGTFLQDYVVKELPEVHERVLALVTVLAKKPNLKDLPAVVRALQNLYEVVVLDLRAEKQPLESQNVCGLAGVSELLFADVVELPDPGDASFFRQLRRFITILSTKESMLDVPKNLEAQRRIAFFSNSLFMNMPRAPTVEKMLAFSVLTPYYSEDVMYSKEKLQVRNEDGISIIYYLQKIFPDEWDNFKERMRRDKGVKEEKELWNPDNALQLRLWASYRGQTLARTVRGMMYYQQALKLLAYLDGASQIEMQEGRELLAAASVRGERTNASAHVAPTSSHPWVLNRIGSGVGGLFKEAQQDAVANMKFTYVVTCQIYGAQKAKKHVQADDILFLMKTYNALRIAYVDEVEVITGGSYSKQYFSVLVKYDSLLEKEVEIYRIQLPGPLKLGEGKPENQNHAIIFTRGDAVQTIDMNQDNYFEETLKARNLLQEFTVHHGLRRPQILGVREHVFTGSVSSLASFMSAQETSFVTLGQRVLANPLKVRMHYGHPDVFDRLWFVTRGGISKASKVINISEDIFAGFNCTLRGGNVTHHEYIQAGKGRDVGLNQIALFEAKVASGNGEQILSRDVYRLGHRLDFFRMLSFYYTTVGFFISNMMVVLTVYAFLWGRVYIALSGLDKSIEGDGIFANRALTASLNQQFIVQLGIFTALPMIVENSIERGFASAIWDFVTMQLQLSSVFFTFSLGTRAHFFGRTVLHGGAKYRATGRGFVVVHEKFAHIYRLFSRSHFVKGVELIVLLVIYESFAAIGSNTTAYILITFSSWFLALSWITGPFLFNPSGFDWLKTVEDFDDFLEWIWHRKGIATKSEMSWEIWWDEEQDHLRSTGFWGKVIEVVLNLRFLFLQYGVVYQLDIAGNSKSILVYLLSWVYMAVVGVIYIILVLAAARLSVRKHIYYRLVQASVAIFVVAVVIMLVQLTSFHIVDALLSLLAFVPTGWGLLSIALVYKNLLQRTPLWPFIVSMARLYELGIGIMVFIPVAVLSWLPGFQNMQTRILFNQAFSRGLQISRILVGKRPNSGF